MSVVLFIDIAYYRPTIAAISGRLAEKNVQCLYGWLGEGSTDSDDSMKDINLIEKHSGDL